MRVSSQVKEGEGSERWYARRGRTQDGGAGFASQQWKCWGVKEEGGQAGVGDFPPAQRGACAGEVRNWSVVSVGFRALRGASFSCDGGRVSQGKCMEKQDLFEVEWGSLRPWQQVRMGGGSRPWSQVINGHPVNYSKAGLRLLVTEETQGSQPPGLRLEGVVPASVNPP